MSITVIEFLEPNSTKLSFCYKKVNGNIFFFCFKIPYLCFMFHLKWVRRGNTLSLIIVSYENLHHITIVLLHRQYKHITSMIGQKGILGNFILHISSKYKQNHIYLYNSNIWLYSMLGYTTFAHIYTPILHHTPNVRWCAACICKSIFRSMEHEGLQYQTMIPEIVEMQFHIRTMDRFFWFYFCLDLNFWCKNEGFFFFLTP